MEYKKLGLEIIAKFEKYIKIGGKKKVEKKNSIK